MTIKRVKRTLADSIKTLAAEKQLFSRNPGKDNTRNRKLPFEKVVAAILSFQGGTLNRELMDFFDLNSASPTTSAFVQQRAKILPAAFESLFHHFTDRICEQKTYNGYRLFAVDGSDLQIAANPQDADSFAFLPHLHAFAEHNGKRRFFSLDVSAVFQQCRLADFQAVANEHMRNVECPLLCRDVERIAVASQHRRRFFRPDVNAGKRRQFFNRHRRHVLHRPFYYLEAIGLLPARVSPCRIPCSSPQM